MYTGWPVLTLPQLTGGPAGGPVVTTNFDRILKRVFQAQNAPIDQVIWGSQVHSISRAIIGNQRFLFKPHGDADERTARVLTKTEYDENYAPRDSKGLRARLGRLFQGRTLLFIGCSLGPDRTMDVLREALEHAADGHHLAIVEKPTADEEFFAKQQFLGSSGIFALWYPPGRHDLIEPVLRWIASLQPLPAPGLDALNLI